MLIKARTKDLDSSYGALFRQILAINYNLQVDMRYPRMDESIFDEHWASEHNDFKKWTLSSEGVVQQREMMQMKLDKCECYRLHHALACPIFLILSSYSRPPESRTKSGNC
jgi:hypothetical protein